MLFKQPQRVFTFIVEHSHISTFFSKRVIQEANYSSFITEIIQQITQFMQLFAKYKAILNVDLFRFDAEGTQVSFGAQIV